MKIAIHQNKRIFNHNTTWEKQWVLYCEENNLKYEIIDCFSVNILDKLHDFDILVWHYQNYVLQEMNIAKSILFSANKMNLKIFPDYNTSWHYDDKLAQSFMLKSIDAICPNNYIFSEKLTAIEWVRNKANFPIIAKLKCGSGSHNVKLLKNKYQACSYIKKMFSSGMKASPSIFFKASSNIKSSTNSKTFIDRFKKIPDFIQTFSRAKRFPKEKDYCYFQEYISNNGFDIKVIVIDDKATFFIRNIRKGDFRASGGGSFFYDKSLVPENVIRSAFEVSNKFKFQCMGYDFVIDKKSNQGKIIEMSYGFSYSAVLGAGGYWDNNLNWHNTPLNIPNQILINLLKNE